MVKPLSEALARSRFLRRGSISEVLARPDIVLYVGSKLSNSHRAVGMRCIFGLAQYKYLDRFSTYHNTQKLPDCIFLTA